MEQAGQGNIWNHGSYWRPSIQGSGPSPSVARTVAGLEFEIEHMPFAIPLNRLKHSLQEARELVCDASDTVIVQT